jgi:hypothetical protein
MDTDPLPDDPVAKALAQVAPSAATVMSAR